MKTIETEIEKIFDKHLVAYTKKTQVWNDESVEVTSFDTVVVNIFEAKEDLKALFEKYSQERFEKAMLDTTEHSKVCFVKARGYEGCSCGATFHNALVDEIRRRWENKDI